VERAFGRLKHEYALTPLRARGQAKVALHAELTILANSGARSPEPEQSRSPRRASSESAPAKGASPCAHTDFGVSDRPERPFPRADDVELRLSAVRFRVSERAMARSVKACVNPSY
jgi:hypothetical protein